MTELILWLARSQGESQLERTLYIDSLGTEILAVRGKTAVANKSMGTFQWTPGVKALTVIFLKVLVRELKQIKTVLPLLEGGKGSLAASLDYALTKQPEWLFSMFGSDDHGDAYLRRLLFRSNSGMKRGGPVGISLHEQLLDPQSIKVYVDGSLIKDADELEHIAQKIEAEENSDQAERSRFHSYSEQRNVLWKLGQSISTYNFEPENTDTVFLNSNNDSITQPVAVSNADNIYLFEQLQFPGSCAARDRLIEWKNHLNFSSESLPPSVIGRVVQAKYLFEELTYHTCDDRTRAKFDQWIASMTIERDGEYGLNREEDGMIVPGFLSWIKDHNASAAFTADSLYRTLIWRDRLSGEIVATITVAPDDRGVKARYNLNGDGLIGGTNVRWDLRSRGIGKYISARMDQHIAKFAQQQSKQIIFHTFTHAFSQKKTGTAVLDRLGYQHNQNSRVDTSCFGIGPLWSKQYGVLR